MPNKKIDFSKVIRVFDSVMVDRKNHNVGQVAVFHRNTLQVNHWRNSSNALNVNENTPFLCFSISKVFTACVILKLIDEGKIELDAPISRYWPEFAQKGKETATIRHALLHQAGVPAPHLEQQVFLWPSWQKVTRTLAQEQALYEPGTQTAYHLVNFGFILGEVARRVTGIPIDQYLQEEFFQPMGLCHTAMRMNKAELQQSPKVFALSKELRQTAFVFNIPSIRRALMPAVNLRSTALELGTFFTMLLHDGQYNGKQYLSKEIIRLAASSHYNGFDTYMKYNMNWGLGFIIGGGKYLVENPREWIMGWGSSEETFAGFGMGTCMVWADRRADLVTAFTCNGMFGIPEVDKRWEAISNAVWDSLDG
jgi:CubicO group peptidase (beta-lactamase class C family)